MSRYREGEKVYYFSLTGERVTAVISHPDLWSFLFQRREVVLTSTSRTSRTYPRGFSWSAPESASSIQTREKENTA